jgi:subtilisin family serine protease
MAWSAALPQVRYCYRWRPWLSVCAPFAMNRTVSRLLLLVLVALLIGSSLPLPGTPFVAAAGSVFSSQPDSVSVNLALGTSTEIGLTIENLQQATATPQLFEAYAAPALDAALTSKPAATPELRVALPDQDQRIDPQLAAEIAADGRSTFLVFLHNQADLSAAAQINDWQARGEYVYRTLRDHAEQSQARLRSWLAARGTTYQPLWIVNALIVEGDAADVAALEQHGDVALLRANRTATLPSTPLRPAHTRDRLAQFATCDADANNVCWNIVRIGADRVWRDFGVTGAGIVVASIDSGVAYTHPALVEQYRGYEGGSTFDHDYNWYDPFAETDTPRDSGTHGTHTMGTMIAAGSSPSAPAVGVAPDAEWIAARPFGTNNASQADIILSAEWLLAPTDLDGNNPRPALRPHIINNSWSTSADNTIYSGYVAAWRAAGIFPVFAAGNDGTITSCSTVLAPGNYVDVVAVGSVDSNDRLSSFSSKGPGPDGRLKPDVTAPGSSILSTVPPTGNPLTYYSLSSGTSMATPHVAGTVALLWSANPDLIGDYDETYRILSTTALPITVDDRYDNATYADCLPGLSPNNLYGHGRIDAYNAVAEARIDVPWMQVTSESPDPIAPGGTTTISVTVDAAMVPVPGTYEARLLLHTDDLTETPLAIPFTLTVPDDPDLAEVSGVLSSADTGTPLAGSVTVTDGATAYTDAEGRYRLNLPAATEPYTLTADSDGYVTQSFTVTLTTGEQEAVDFALERDIPRLGETVTPATTTLAYDRTQPVSVTLRNDGTQVLSYTLTIPTQYFGVWRSDQVDGPDYRWIEPPADAQLLSLGDDDASDAIPIGFNFGFNTTPYDQIYIGSNGILSFQPPLTGSGFVRGCLPMFESIDAAIAVLHTDLDPRESGAEISYATTDEGFLVTWENVPLFDKTDQRLSFQALLQPDGRIQLNYRNVGTLSATLGTSYGLQYSYTTIQELGCGIYPQLFDGLTIELRPQVNTDHWTTLTEVSGNIAPGASTDVTVELAWYPPLQNWIASADLIINSNDPVEPVRAVPLRLNATSEPYRLYLLQIASE